MNNEDQSGFVRFAWGRSRLPPKAFWKVNMKLLRRNTGEDSLPVGFVLFSPRTGGSNVFQQSYYCYVYCRKHGIHVPIEGIYLPFIWEEVLRAYAVLRTCVFVHGLQVSHTCFFSVELPPYSTEELMRKGLLTAIHFGMGGILNA